MQITFSITKPVGEITITSQNSQGAYIASEGDEKLWLFYPELRSLEFSPLPGNLGKKLSTSIETTLLRACGI